MSSLPAFIFPAALSSTAGSIVGSHNRECASKLCSRSLLAWHERWVAPSVARVPRATSSRLVFDGKAPWFDKAGVSCRVRKYIRLVRPPRSQALRVGGLSISCSVGSQGDSDRLNAIVPSEDLLKAVQELGYRVTVGDVASKVGLPVKRVRQELTALAYNAGGHLQVAESGDLVYLFPENFRQIFRDKNLKVRLVEFWRQWADVIYRGIRISFGLALFVSILVVVATFAAISISSSSSSRDDREDRRRSSFYFGPSLFDFYYWSRLTSPGYYSPYYTSPRLDLYEPEERGMNFLEAVYSFVFGDGDPNATLREQQWTTVASVIRNNGGSVVAEQILPYLDIKEFPTNKSFYDYEDYMLPVLLRFNGAPQVGPNGEIVYVFPDLQTMATKSSLPDFVKNVVAQKEEQIPVPSYLRERPLEFSLATPVQKLMVGGLGLFNLFGVTSLGNILGDGRIAARIGGLVGVVGSLYWLLALYAAVFVAVPAFRLIYNQLQNPKITARNNIRRDRALELIKKTPALASKLDYAKTFAQRNVIRRKDIVYTTEKEMSEQEAENRDRLDQDWKRRLRE